MKRNKLLKNANGGYEVFLMELVRSVIWA
uniref:Uncharacterized protein n=1 Tax=Anguilla anguilla TaxID=7936 RepID=A0A0E9SW51_ANGAN